MTRTTLVESLCIFSSMRVKSELIDIPVQGSSLSPIPNCLPKLTRRPYRVVSTLELV